MEILNTLRKWFGSGQPTAQPIPNADIIQSLKRIETRLESSAKEDTVIQQAEEIKQAVTGAAIHQRTEIIKQIGQKIEDLRAERQKASSPVIRKYLETQEAQLHLQRKSYEIEQLLSVIERMRQDGRAVTAQALERETVVGSGNPNGLWSRPTLYRLLHKLKLEQRIVGRSVGRFTFYVLWSELSDEDQRMAASILNEEEARKIPR